MEIKYLQFTYLLKNMKEMSLNMHFFFGRGGGEIMVTLVRKGIMTQN